MADLDDVRRLALALPEVAEGFVHDNVAWKVRGKLFVWERPLNQKDVTALGADAPDGVVLGVRVGDEGNKLALIDEDPDVFFTIPHFDGYAAALLRLDRIGEDRLGEVITDSWLLRAPKRVAAAYLADHPPAAT